MQTLGMTLLLFPTLLLSSRAEELRFFRIVGPVRVTITACSADGCVTWTNAATNATFTVQIANSLLNQTNWVDYVQVPVAGSATTHRLFDANAPTDMVFIPAGSFTMGNCMNPLDGGTNELPLHTVYVSAFYMDKYEVTQALWDDVRGWSTGNGYDLGTGAGSTNRHPVLMVNWFRAAKWCNARSQKEGREAVYYTDAGLTVVYKTNQVSPFVKWDANGYRLPTEAEWEKAARGGARGHRFPWSHTDDITHSLANYWSSAQFAYDTSPTRGFHPVLGSECNGNPVPVGIACAGPVGYFGPNGYGLHDMAGNLSEWCWDGWDENWYSNVAAIQSDTRGPPGPLTERVIRGGCWACVAGSVRCANRGGLNPAVIGCDIVGFRCVRGH